MKHLYAATCDLSIEITPNSTACGLPWEKDFDWKEYRDINCLECWQVCKKHFRNELDWGNPGKFQLAIETNLVRLTFNKDFKEVIEEKNEKMVKKS